MKTLAFLILAMPLLAQSKAPSLTITQRSQLRLLLAEPEPLQNAAMFNTMGCQEVIVLGAGNHSTSSRGGQTSLLDRGKVWR